MVEDITIDGINIVRNFQEQFLTVMQGQGIEALLDRLNEMNQKHTEENPFADKLRR